jgi:hypothetical protein
MISWKASRYGDIRIKYAFSEISADKGEETATNELKMQIRLWF